MGGERKDLAAFRRVRQGVVEQGARVKKAVLAATNHNYAPEAERIKPDKEKSGVPKALTLCVCVPYVCALTFLIISYSKEQHISGGDTRSQTATNYSCLQTSERSMWIYHVACVVICVALLYDPIGMMHTGLLHRSMTEHGSIQPREAVQSRGQGRACLAFSS